MIKRKRFFNLNVYTILILTFLIIMSKSAFAIGVCCYNGDLVKSIRPIFSDNCDSGEVEVGDFSTNPTCDYESLHKGCMINGVCYEKVFGNEIYDMPAVKNFFQSNFQIDITNYCDQLVPFDASTCSGSYQQSGAVSTGNQNNANSQNTGSSVNYQNIPIPQQNQVSTSNFVFCSSAGGPFNLFMTKDSCNDIENSNGFHPCLYNPYLTGIIKTSSAQGNDYGLGTDEFGCVPKVLIKKCSDYKTEENCENNPVYNDPTYKNTNLQSCKWVNRSDYFKDFDVGGGVCISNVVSDKKNFNFAYYSNRLNLLKNPSFEDDLNDWLHSPNFNSVVKIDNSAYDGDKDLILKPNDWIGQKVDYIESQKSYLTTLYVKKNETFSSNDILSLEIVDHYPGGTTKDFTYTYNLEDMTCFNNTFCKVQFNEHIESQPIKFTEFILKTNKAVTIDAIDFEQIGAKYINVPTDTFKPVSVISSNASNCEFCYNKRGMNFCTKNKSDLMGDCSYMVDNLSQIYQKVNNPNDYLGKDENKYLNNWSSQSIANSKVFCEMYLSKDKCLDPDNYVNSKFGPLHHSKGSTLCKWDDKYGCYKDSDDSDGPDTIEGGTVFLTLSNLLLQTSIQSGPLKGFSDNFFQYYQYATTNNKISDYDYACDLIPPHAYLYLTAKNLTLDNILINNNAVIKNLIGDINLNYEVYDLKTEACNSFNIPTKILVDYSVNNSKGFRTFFLVIPNNFVQGVIKLKDLLVGQNGKTLLVDGINNVTIKIKDQSGNVGKVFNFSINSDLNGPNVTLLTDINNKVFSKEPKLNFNITDASGIDYCNYSLTPLSNVQSNSQIKDSYYNKSGDFFSRSLTQPDNTYLFTVPIFNGTDQVNVYQLQINCSDKFLQKTSKDYYLYIDAQTNLTLLKPVSFVSKDLDFGFYNNSMKVWAISDEKLKTCQMDFKNTNGQGSLNLNIVNNGFTNSNYGSTLFYSNITGTIDFTTSGKKNISINCTDQAGNKISKDIILYYDKLPPKINSFSLSNPTNKIVTLKSNNNYYVRREDPMTYTSDAILNLILNGTKSFPSDQGFAISYKVNGQNSNNNNNNNNNQLVKINSVNLQGFTLFDNGTGEFNVTGFMNLLNYIGEDQNDHNLYKQTYLINFTDKAQNTHSEDISFYFDNSVPDFIFHGNSYNYGNAIYSTKLKPSMNITFNTPKYREFNCSVTIPYLNGNFKKQFGYTNDLTFNISDIIPTFTQLNQNTGLPLNLNCKDKYNVTLAKNYQIYYDNTPPELNSVYFENGNHIYLPNVGANYIYNDINDSLVFKLNDTNEKGYQCFYRFNSSFYKCDQSWFNSTFAINSLLTFKTPEIALVSDNPQINRICYRDQPTFNNNLNAAILAGQNIYKTSINVTAYCEDYVKLKTDVYSFNYSIDYISGSQFVDFNVSYGSGKVYFTIKSLTPYDKVDVAFDDNDQNKIVELSSVQTTANGVTVYKGSKDLSFFGSNTNNNILVWGIGLWNNGAIADKISKNMIIDNLMPTGELSFPDADQNDFIYSKDFEIKLHSKDFGGSHLNKVNLYLDNQKIYSSNGTFDNQKINVLNSNTYFSANKDEFFGDLVFKNGTIGQSYNFTLEMIDGYGNINKTSKIVFVKDGINIKVLDSANCFVDGSGLNWVTKLDAPTIKFQTSRDATSCKIYPYYDSEWSNIIQSANILNQAETILGSNIQNRIYNLDLTKYIKFNISKLSDKSAEIKISCLYKNKEYNFTRTIDNINNMLPDYVLNSSKGFVISGDTETDLNITSVGPNRYVQCQYAFDNNPLQLISNDYKISFLKTINFSTFSDGTHILKIRCADKLGTEGPLKEYKFIVNKNPDIIISNLSLIKNNQLFKPSISNNKIYIPSTQNYGLVFSTNRGDITCHYEIKKTGTSLITKLIALIKNFFVKEEDIPQADKNSHIFKVNSGLNFTQSSVSILRIVCDGKKNIIKEYNVTYNDTPALSFNLQ